MHGITDVRMASGTQPEGVGQNQATHSQLIHEITCLHYDSELQNQRTTDGVAVVLCHRGGLLNIRDRRRVPQSFQGDRSLSPL